MKFRTWLSIVTLALLAVVVIVAWKDIAAAFQRLSEVNLWVLSLMLPIQFISYFSTGEMLFSYLRAKGNIKDLNPLKATRLSLEFNFVNHVFPSGGAAGITYLTWQLGHYGVPAGRSTMAQVVRFGLTFLSFILLLVVALVVLIIDHSVNRYVILLSLLLVVLAVGSTLGIIYVISSHKRLTNFSVWLTEKANRVVKKVTRGRKQNVVKQEPIVRFFTDIHDDYLGIRRDKSILLKPFIWSVIANLADVALLFVAFASLGVVINPATLFIAFGLSSIVSAVAITPGGAGFYEAVMIAFLSTAGVPPPLAIAGTLLARVMLLLITIVFGYVFYQHSVLKYGTRPLKR